MTAPPPVAAATARSSRSNGARLRPTYLILFYKEIKSCDEVGVGQRRPSR
jgi:hypothetical protein